MNNHIPHINNVCYFQSRMVKILLNFGFNSAKLHLIEVDESKSVINRHGDISPEAFPNSNPQECTKKPFTLCLYKSNGNLTIALPFENIDASFQVACQCIAQLTPGCN